MMSLAVRDLGGFARFKLRIGRSRTAYGHGHSASSAAVKTPLGPSPCRCRDPLSLHKHSLTSSFRALIGSHRFRAPENPVLGLVQRRRWQQGLLSRPAAAQPNSHISLSGAVPLTRIRSSWMPKRW